jgi:hypothetical protein
MTARVTIPAELAADVKARPEAYRPDVEPGTDVLVLAVTNVSPDLWSGSLRRTCGRYPDPAYPGLVQVHAGWHAGVDASAWALVGAAGVPDDHPVKVGDLVLVLGCESNAEEHLGLVGRIAHGHMGDDVVLVEASASGCTATRWAILPDPAPKTDRSFVQAMAAAHPTERYVPAATPPNPQFAVMWDYVVVSVDKCTCDSPGGEFSHRDSCGWEPVIRVDELTALGFTAPGGPS